MATTKKPAAPAVAKEAPAASAKPAVKAVAVAAKPAEPKAAPAVKKVAAKAAPKAPAKAPVVAKPVAAKAVAPVAKAKAGAKAKTKSASIDPGQRANYIEVAAFYIAERRGFAPGNPEQDYLEAAAEIDRLIDAGHFGK